MHLTLWLLLHSPNHNSTRTPARGVQCGGGCWCGASRAAAAPLNPAGRGPGEQSSSSAPAPSLLGSFRTVSCRVAARKGTVRLQRGRVPGSAPAAPPRPRSLEPSGRRRAGWVLPASGEPLCEAAPIECPANFQKLLQIKGRGDRHRAGPQSGRVWPEGDAGRAHQPVTRNFPAKPPRRTALCLLPSTAILASRFAGELGSE